MTASASGVIGFARAASTDMPLAAMFTHRHAGLVCVARKCRQILPGAVLCFPGTGHAGQGAGRAVFGAVIVVIFAAAKGDYRLIARTLWLPGVFVSACGPPWYIAVQLRNPEFFEYSSSNIIWRVLARTSITTPSLSGITCRWLCSELVPWTMFIAVAMIESIRVWWKEKKRTVRVQRSFASISYDLAHRPDCIFFVLGIEAAGLHSAGTAGRYVAAGGICATTCSRRRD